MKYEGTLGIRLPDVETSPGVFEVQIQEVTVIGDAYSSGSSWPAAEQRETTLNMTLSIFPPSTPDILVNEIVYASFQGSKWTVTRMDYQRPRVKLTLGRRYNG